MKTRLAVLAGVAALVLASACFAQTAEVVDLPTRPGVRQRMLVLQPDHATAVVVLLTGGNGQLGIHDNGSLRSDGNFLVRSRSLFVHRGLITFTGGRSSGNVCDAFAYHGYNGIEQKVVADIAAFVAAPPKAGPP